MFFDLYKVFIYLDMLLRVDDEFASVCPNTLKPHFSVNIQWNFNFFISNNNMVFNAIVLFFQNQEVDIVDDQFIFEVGGKNKDFKQIKDIKKQQALTNYFEQQIKSKISDSYQFVPPGTKNSLLIRLAFTNMEEKTIRN